MNTLIKWITSEIMLYPETIVRELALSYSLGLTPEPADYMSDEGVLVLGDDGFSIKGD
jgi:hypothetical protein